MARKKVTMEHDKRIALVAHDNEPPCCKQQGIRGKRPVLKEPCFTL
jgi:hypothetical protein